jgi:hypothetical protein
MGTGHVTGIVLLAALRGPKGNIAKASRKKTHSRHKNIGQRGGLPAKNRPTSAHEEHVHA